MPGPAMDSVSRNHRPYLLLTNDDGIDAPGLHALANALAGEYDLMIVAPHRERSGAGHAITVLRDLRLERFEREGIHWGWSFQGKPADCVKVAVTTISKNRPFDLVLSGINRGQNLGINVLYSGTVAAAREAVVLGLPAIAFSLSYLDLSDVRFDAAARVAADITARVLARGLPPGVFLNVNIPPVPFDSIQGYAITRQGDSSFRDRFEQIGGSPEGLPLYRNVGDRFHKSSSDDENLDDRAVKHGRVSITPLHLDTTAHHHLEGLRDLEGPRPDRAAGPII